MKKLLYIILILSLAVPAFGAINTAVISTKGSKNNFRYPSQRGLVDNKPKFEYYFHEAFGEGFEGTGYENTGWTETVGTGCTVDEDEAGTVLSGSQSLKLIGAASQIASIGRSVSTGNGLISTDFMFRVTALPSAEFIFIRYRSGATATIQARLNTDGTVRVYNGDYSAYSSVVVAANTTYYCRFEFQNGTGSNSITRLWVNATNSFSDSPDCEITNGTTTSDIDNIFIGWSNLSQTAYYDNIVIRDQTASTVKVALIDQEDLSISVVGVPAPENYGTDLGYGAPRTALSSQIVADSAQQSYVSFSSLFASDLGPMVMLVLQDDMDSDNVTDMQITAGAEYADEIVSMLDCGYPSIAISYGDAGQFTMIAGKVLSGSDNKISLFKTTTENVATPWNDEVVIKTADANNSAPAIVKYASEDTRFVQYDEGDQGVVYTSKPSGSAASIYYKHWTQSTDTWGSATKIVDAGCLDVASFAATVTSQGTLCVAYRDSSDTTKINMITRTQAGTVGTAFEFTSDLDTDTTNGGFGISASYDNPTSPKIVLLYYDGTDIEKVTWTESTSSLGTGSIGTVSEFINEPALIAGYQYLELPYLFLDNLPLVYQTDDFSVRIAIDNGYTLSTGITNEIGTDINFFGRISDRQGTQNILTDSYRSLMIMEGMDKITYAALYNHTTNSFDIGWTAVTGRYCDLHNRGQLTFDKDGYVLLTYGGRCSPFACHALTIKKSDYPFDNVNFNLTVSGWDDVTPTLDDANSDGISDTNTRGYKEIISDDEAFHLFTETSSAMYIRAYAPFWDVAEGDLLDEDFEGTGYENAGWTEAVGAGCIVDEDFSTVAGHGSQCLKITGAASQNSYTQTSITSSSVVVSRFMVYFPTIPAASTSFYRLLDASANSLTYLRIESTGGIRAFNGTDYSDLSTAITAAKWYYVWVKYTKGTGANSTTEFFVNDTGAIDDSVITATGGATADAATLRLGHFNQPYTFYIDQLFSDTTGFTLAKTSQYKWFDPVKINDDSSTSGSISYGGYWAGNGLTLGKETTGQKSIHVFQTFRRYDLLWPSLSQAATDLAYTKAVYQQNGEYKFYKADDTELTPPLDLDNNDIVITDMTTRQEPAGGYTRINSTAYLSGDFISQNSHAFKCTTSGTTASSAPTFDTDHGATTTDGTAVWTEIGHAVDGTTDLIQSFLGQAAIYGTDTPSMVTQIMDNEYAFKRNLHTRWDETNWDMQTIDETDQYMWHQFVNDIGTGFIFGSTDSDVSYKFSKDNGVTWSGNMSIDTGDGILAHVVATPRTSTNVSLIVQTGLRIGPSCDEMRLVDFIAVVDSTGRIIGYENSIFGRIAQ